MQISATAANSLTSLSPLKSKQALETPVAAPQPQADVDSFTATTSWTGPQAAEPGTYKKPVLPPEPLAESIKKEPEQGPTITTIAEEAVKLQAEAPEPPSFGAQDLQQLLQSFGRKNGEEGFNANLDVNGDGLIDGCDLSVALSNFRRAGS